MRHTLLRARTAARMEPLEGRRMLSLTPTLTLNNPNSTGDGGSHGGHDANAIHVDDDRQQCPDAEFTSIQAAVVAAPPFSTIYVCPGVYREEVVVPKPLTLLGSSHDRSAAHSTRGEDPQHDSIIEPPVVPITSIATGLVRLAADDIVFDGFVVQKNIAGPGIYTSPLFSGYSIERNTIQENVFGLYLHAAGPDQTIVEGNWFDANNQPGSSSGDGIYSDQGLRDVLVQRNVFTNHASASMVFTSVPPTFNEDITVRRNAIIDDNAIVVINTRNVLVEKNFIRRTDGSGIFDGGGNVNVLIDSNLLDETGRSGIVVASDFAPASTGVLVTRNLVGDAGRNGILLYTANGVRVKRNIVLRSALDGIQVTNSSNNLVADNLSLHNGRDGIRVGIEIENPPQSPTPVSVNNKIISNTMRKNLEHDAHDDTVGGGTAGTANYWIDNNCKTENRPGLCGNPHDDHDDEFYAAQEQSYSTALSADPLVGGEIVIPTFDVPEETAVPPLPDLDILGIVPDALIRSGSDKPWLDAEHA